MEEEIGKIKKSFSYTEHFSHQHNIYMECTWCDQWRSLCAPPTQSHLHIKYIQNTWMFCLKLYFHSIYMLHASPYKCQSVFVPFYYVYSFVFLLAFSLTVFSLFLFGAAWLVKLECVWFSNHHLFDLEISLVCLTCHFHRKEKHEKRKELLWLWISARQRKIVYIYRKYHKIAYN